MEELEVILLETQSDLADLAVQEKIHEVVQKVHKVLDEEEYQDHQRK